MEEQALIIFQKIIGYYFRDEKLLLQALTHSSFSNEQRINSVGNYEREEFLGDAVLELITSAFLFEKYPDMPEGELTKFRASIVCEPTLALCARQMELDKFLRLGRGEENTGGRNRDSIISDVFEAVIGAIYLDGGMEAAKAHIERFVLNDIEDKKLFSDSKSTLQEVVQGQLKKDVSYKLVSETGPEHDKEFRVKAIIGGNALGEGTGRTKKAAEQKAAYAALLKLKEQGYVFKKH